MSNTYFGFAVSDSMFNGDSDIRRKAISEDEAARLIKDAIICLNPSHKATISVMTEKFGIQVEIPETPPRVSLSNGDSLVVMGVRGLPRLTDRHEYSPEEISGATFKFSLYTISTR